MRPEPEGGAAGGAEVNLAETVGDSEIGGHFDVLVLELLRGIGEAVKNEAAFHDSVEFVLKGESVRGDQHLHALLGGHVLKLGDVGELIFFSIVLAEDDLARDELHHSDIICSHNVLLKGI